jgi:hypothetical protein
MAEQRRANAKLEALWTFTVFVWDLVLGSAGGSFLIGGVPSHGGGGG